MSTWLSQQDIRVNNTKRSQVLSPLEVFFCFSTCKPLLVTFQTLHNLGTTRFIVLNIVTRTKIYYMSSSFVASRGIERSHVLVLCSDRRSWGSSWRRKSFWLKSGMNFHSSNRKFVSESCPDSFRFSSSILFPIIFLGETGDCDFCCFKIITLTLGVFGCVALSVGSILLIEILTRFFSFKTSPCELLSVIILWSLLIVIGFVRSVCEGDCSVPHFMIGKLSQVLTTCDSEFDWRLFCNCFWLLWVENSCKVDSKQVTGRRCILLCKWQDALVTTPPFNICLPLEFRHPSFWPNIRISVTCLKMYEK